MGTRHTAGQFVWVGKAAQRNRATSTDRVVHPLALAQKSFILQLQRLLLMCLGPVSNHLLSCLTRSPCPRSVLAGRYYAVASSPAERG